MSETMADYEDQINASFRSSREGDMVTGEVVSVEEEEVLLDLRSFSQGVIPSGEYSDDPNFHAMDEIRTGEMLTAVVLSPDDGQVPARGKKRRGMGTGREGTGRENGVYGKSK